MTPDNQPVVLTEQGRRIHRAGILIDGHNDLPYKLRHKAVSSFDKMDLSQPQKELQTDIPRLRRGGITGPMSAPA